MNKTNSLVLAVALTVTGGVTSAMSFSELQSAIDAASSGDTVYVTSDVTYDQPLVIAKGVTIASAAGDEAFVLRPAAKYMNGTLLTLNSEEADVTMENIVFDGQRGTTNQNSRSLFELTAGTLTLGNGAKIQNRYCPSYPAVQVSSKGVFVMEDGSEIRGVISDNYGVAVKTGAAGNSPSDGKFYMNGGLITECAGHHRDVQSAAWDGVIYLYGGSFYAHGGTVCGNTSDYSTAGICNYFGNVYVSGSFTATNNIGKLANDYCRCQEIGDSNVLMIDDDYTGHMTVKCKFEGDKENPVVEGNVARYIYTSKVSSPRLGCENIVAEDDPTLALDLSPSQIFGGWYPKWRKIAAKVSGEGHMSNKFSLANALEYAESGDTIALCKDAVFTQKTTIEKDLTITSDEGCTYVIRRNSVNVPFAAISNATVTIRNVVLDGNDIACTSNYGMIEAETDGVAVLDSGAVIRNCVVPTNGGAVFVRRRSGAKLVMKDGALITACSNTGNGFGVAVCISEGASVEGDPPTFEMQGGCITGCTVNGTGAVKSGYGGVVYCWMGAVFDMSGGSITGNFGVNNSGVVNYLGTVRVTGSAVIEGNSGEYSDLYNCNTRQTYYYGDFRGRVNVSNGATADDLVQTAGKSFRVKWSGDDATGAWCFHPTRAETELVGSVANGTTVVWTEPIGAVSGVKAATKSELQAMLPVAFDMNVGSSDYDRLPIVLSGAATELGANVTLDFDKDMRKHMPAWSTTLFAANEGETLSGSWNFALPEGAEANWGIVSTDTTHSLAYYPPGMLLIVK